MYPSENIITLPHRNNNNNTNISECVVNICRRREATVVGAYLHTYAVVAPTHNNIPLGRFVDEEVFCFK